MKKLLALLLAALMVVCTFAACSKKGDETTTADTTTGSNNTNTTTPASTDSASTSDNTTTAAPDTTTDEITTSEASTGTTEAPPPPSYNGVDVSNIKKVTADGFYNNNLDSAFESHHSNTGLVVVFTFPNMGTDGAGSDWPTRFTDERADLTIMVKIKDTVNGEWKLYNGGSLSNEDGSVKSSLNDDGGYKWLMRLEIIPEEVFGMIDGLALEDAKNVAWEEGYFYYPDMSQDTSFYIQIEMWNADKTAVVYQLNTVKFGYYDINDSMTDADFKKDTARPSTVNPYVGGMQYVSVTGTLKTGGEGTVNQQSDSESFPKIFDNSIKTKVLIPNAGDFSKIYITFTTTSKIAVKGFSYILANDAATSRNPVGYTVEYSTDDGTTWIALTDAEVEVARQQTFAENYVATATNTTEASMYRLVLSPGTTSIQLSELWLFT